MKARSLLQLFLACLLFWMTSASAGVLLGNYTLINNTTSATLTLTPPNGSKSGDLQIAQIATKDWVTITPPSGWTEYTSAAVGTNNLRMRLYWRIAGSSATSNQTWTLAYGSDSSGPKSAGTSGLIISTQTTQPSTPFCGANYQTFNSLYDPIAPNVHTTCDAESIRFAFFAADHSGTVITPASGTGISTIPAIQTDGDTRGVSVAGSYFTMSSSGNGGNLTATQTNNKNGLGLTLIVKSATANQCFTDTFNRSTGLGSDWMTSTRSSFSPVISNESGSYRLRLTDASTQQATAATLQKWFPGTANKIVISFQYFGYPYNRWWGNTPADGIAVVLSDASQTPYPGQAGGSLGYAAGTSGGSGFSGGWLAVGLDEYGNFANSNIAGPCASGVSCSTSAIPESVSVRGSSSNYSWLKGTSTLSGYVSNDYGQYYRITLDSTSGKPYLKVERDPWDGGTNYSTILNAFDISAYSGQNSLPANFLLSFTGSTGNSVNKHEIDNLKICAITQNEISSVDHIRLEITGTPLTCTPSTLTVKACADSTCSTLASSATTVALTASNGATLGSSSLAVTGSATTTLRKTTAGSTTLGANGGTSNTTRCFLNGSEISNCTYTFADSGLLLTAPTLTAGKSDTMTIAAVRASDNALQCVPAFANVSRSVKFWSSYSTPNTGTLPLKLGSSGAALPGNSTVGTALTLSFDANGRATLPVQYDDAGQVLLKARYDGSASNAPTPDAEPVMTGSSTLTSIPHGLCVDSTDTGWTCSAANTSCAAFRKAGEAFNLRVTGKAYSSTTTDICAMPTTPNYIQANIALASSVVAPSGGSNGNVGTSAISISTGGTATISQTQSEVGVFKFTATPPTGAYFGQTVPAGESANFGRFIPAKFLFSNGTLINRRDINTGAAETCSGGFTYLGEPLGLGFSLSAVNTAGGVTRNYRDGFARLALTPAGLNFGAQQGTTLLNDRLNPSCASGVCGTWSNGMATIAATATVTRATMPDGPFNAAKFGVKPIEDDGVPLSAPDYNWSLSGSSDGKLIGTTALRYGRMRMSNAYGSALLPLPITTVAQYWNGSAFVTNTDDSCTLLTAPVVSSSAIDSVMCSGGIKLYGNLTSVTASVNSPIKSGVAGLKLAKPSYTNTGNLYLDLALSVPDYLKYNWNGLDQDPSTPTCPVASDGDKNDDNPRARIRFGAKTNNSIIYLREIY